MIEVRDVTKRYGDTVAVDGLSFTVRSGQVTGFLGPNGSGKSTTMRLIMGLDAPDSGEVTVNRRPYRDLEWPLREVGALLEAKAIHPGRSAYNHLLELAQTNDISKKRIEDVLGLVGLMTVARKRVGAFSLGMGQRLGIAAALLGDPQVLLLDEPANGLDPEGIRWMRRLLKQLAGEGRTVFVSSHLISEMELIADQLVVIGHGKLLAQMPVAEFISSHSERFVRVRSRRLPELAAAIEIAGGRCATGEDGSIQVTGLDSGAVGELAASLGVSLSELSTQASSLEEVFMDLTAGEAEFRGASDPGSHRTSVGGGPTR